VRRSDLVLCQKENRGREGATTAADVSGTAADVRERASCSLMRPILVSEARRGADDDRESTAAYRRLQRSSRDPAVGRTWFEKSANDFPIITPNRNDLAASNRCRRVRPFAGLVTGLACAMELEKILAEDPQAIIHRCLSRRPPWCLHGGSAATFSRVLIASRSHPRRLDAPRRPPAHRQSPRRYRYTLTAPYASHPRDAAGSL
jgi:hypothetical protein